MRIEGKNLISILRRSQVKALISVRQITDSVDAHSYILAEIRAFAKRIPMLDRTRAITLLRQMIAAGQAQRDLFVQVVVDQNDWLAALTNKVYLTQALRLDVAEHILSLFTLNPENGTEQVIRAINSWVEKDAMDGNRSERDVERLRIRVLNEFSALLEGNTIHTDRAAL